MLPDNPEKQGIKSAFLLQKNIYMENQTLMDSSFGDMRLSDRMKSMIGEIAKWAKLLSIIGFVFIGLIVVIALFAGSMMAALSGMDGEMGMMAGGAITVIYLLLAAIYFFPVLYLYQFASKAQKALAFGSESDIETAFDALRKHYRFLGILTIVMLALYAIGILIGLAGAAALG